MRKLTSAIARKPTAMSLICRGIGEAQGARKEESLDTPVRSEQPQQQVRALGTTQQQKTI